MSGTARRRRGAAAALVGLVSPVVLAPSAPAAETTAADVTSLPDVVYVAHRGGAMEARENSLSGLQSAVDSGVVQVLEVDTRTLSDGTVVVMHDHTVDRTSRASGQVRSHSPVSWPGVVLDTGAWLTPVPTAERAPTLAAVLDRFGATMVLSVEAKDPSAVGSIADLVKGRRLADAVYVSTNDPAVAKRIHARGLRTQLWRTAEQMRGDDPAAFASYVDVLDVDIDASDAAIRRFVASGVPRVWAHTLTTRAERDRAQRLGVTGFVTDDPRYLTGARDTYPMPPTVVRVLDEPDPTQVSDRATMRVVVAQQAGPANPEAVPRVVGRGVTSSSRIDARRVRTLVLSTGAAEAGRGAVTVTVPAGHGSERRWSTGSRRVRLTLTREDLQVRPSVDSHGRRVRLGIRLLDSATADYTGARHETGSTRTVAGLHRAVLTVSLRREGRVVRSTTVRGSDAGPSAPGDGTLRLRWRAPSRGRYVVRVSQRGPVYATVTESRRFRVR